MVTLMSLNRSGREFRTGISRLSSGRTTAVSMPSAPSLSRMAGICLACPTPEGTLSTLISGVPRPSGSGVKACGKSLILSERNLADLLCGSRIHSLLKSQQNSARCAWCRRRISRFSHSLRAFSPTKTNFLTAGKRSAIRSAADDSCRRSASARYTCPSVAIPFSRRRAWKSRYSGSSRFQMRRKASLYSPPVWKCFRNCRMAASCVSSR